MLKTISYQFPYKTHAEKNFFNYLSLLLQELPNFSSEQEVIRIKPLVPDRSLPITTFEPADISYPQIVLDTPEIIDMEIDNIYIRSTQVKNMIRIINHGENLPKTTKSDAQGEYIEIESDNKKFYLLPIEELYKRLKSHIVRIDHTGINIPTKIINQEQWDAFIRQVALESNLYRYPTGEPWLFILPTTKQEYKQEITELLLGREPKFEIVYDEYSQIPTIQIDIESNLSRSDVEKIFPHPYGISFPDLADFFRTVYIDNPWSNLAIRFDIRFKNDALGSDWDTGKWLVNEGGRIKQV